ncbi:MAG: FMN-binding protein [candidate division WOR-3 bacterium]|nr:MAG: FMN-binding protein [candidate division WOR-3 bacterium]
MAIREKTWFPIVYMFVLTLVLSSVLIVFGMITRKRVKENEAIAFERAVLLSLSIDNAGKMTPGQIHQAYLSDIREADEKSAGALRYVRGDSIEGYSLPLEGPGFWARIKGVIGIEPDAMTIKGIAFYEQNETPGLGGEITKEQFRAQFVGKIISATGVPLRIIGPAEPLDESSVHAITGATQTSNRLARFINENLTRWRAKMTEQ